VNINFAHLIDFESTTLVGGGVGFIAVFTARFLSCCGIYALKNALGIKSFG
jgi:hypothetical protein